MIKTAIVSFDEAQILYRAHKDIIVFDSTSGQAAAMQSNQWPYYGLWEPKDRILSKKSDKEIEDVYVFIWVRVV